MLHAALFRDEAGRELDLHWRFLSYTHQPYRSRAEQGGEEDDLWAGRIPLQLGAARSTALNPADQLLHVCAHGVAWNHVPPLRWIADAMTILATAEELDWDKLVVHAERRQLALLLRETLQYLHRTFAAPISAALLQRLQACPVSTRARLEYRQLTAPPHRHDLTTQLFSLYQVFASLRYSERKWRSLVGLLRLAQQAYGIDQLWKVPFHTLLRRTRMLARQVSGGRRT